MKLKTKLIPLVSAASVAAVAIPLATTSCGLTRYTNMLAEYVPGVTPYTKTTIDTIANATEVYKDRTVLNPDIIRDDILYTYSQCFITKESRDRINWLAQFTKYDLDIYVGEVVDEEGTSFTKITYDAYIAGEAAHAMVTDYENVTKFDMHIKCSIFNPETAHFIYDVRSATPGVHKGAFACKDYYTLGVTAFAVPGGYAPRVDVLSEGSLTYIDKTASKEIEIPDYHEHAIFTMSDAWDETENAYAFYPFYEFVGSIPYFGMFDFEIDDDFEFGPGDLYYLLYATHYFKDVTINVA